MYVIDISTRCNSRIHITDINVGRKLKEGERLLTNKNGSASACNANYIIFVYLKKRGGGLITSFYQFYTFRNVKFTLFYYEKFYSLSLMFAHFSLE